MTEAKGLVTRSTGSWYSVLIHSGQIIQCRIRGKFRLEGMKTTNPVAVGDYVTIQFDEKDNLGNIINIEPRKNCIIRKATNLSKQKHIIAANVDISILVATIAFPRTSSGFIDRFLVSAEAYNIRPVVVFNKIDLYDHPSLKEALDYYTQIYSNAGYAVLHVSATERINLDVLHKMLMNKVSMFSGHSGVGKSCLLNALYPNLQLKTGDISEYHLKGKHTTTFAEMHIPEENVFLIDTPGIKEFGLVDFEPWELGHWFPEFRQYLTDCKYNNCLHANEPGCFVREAAQNGKIPMERYINYLGILNNIEEEPAEWE